MLVRGGASLTASVDGTIEIPVGGNAGFTWNANPSDSVKHAVGSTPIALGMVSLTFGGADRVAFAVYSADDGSLDFYKRMDVPEAGDTFEGKTVAAVYTGFETASYRAVGYDSATSNWNTCDVNTPWFGVHDKVKSVKVVDRGIRIHSLERFFQRLENLETANLGNFDLSGTVSIKGLFLLCSSLRSANVPSVSSTCLDFQDAFSYCPSLTDLNFSACDFSGGTNFFHMFISSRSLSFDCSEWNVPTNANHERFNYDAQGVIPPKPWQPTAFAVFNTDDGSLDFYKREFKDMPKTGDTFESKTATEVYTGFETQRFVDTSSDSGNWTAQKPDTPWWNRRLEISSVQVIDTGIKPSSVDYWFYGMENLKTVDVANLDTSSCDDFKMTFGSCVQIETIDLSSWSTASISNLNGTFICCHHLSSLDIDGWNTSKVASFHCLMFHCKKMSSASMQKVVDNLSVTACANDLGFLFDGCEKLTFINLIGWNISNVTNYVHMFFSCCNLTLDCSNWNVLQDAWHGDFNSYAPGVILPKAWQPAAFAVFSADDKSLDFYKREYKDMPKIGDTFNNKTVSEVYSDIEDYDFKISYETSPTGVGNAPWWNHRADILSVKVVDRI